MEHRHIQNGRLARAACGQGRSDASLANLKFAFRQLLKNPGFTAVAVLTLALGIETEMGQFFILTYRGGVKLKRVKTETETLPLQNRLSPKEVAYFARKSAKLELVSWS